MDEDNFNFDQYVVQQDYYDDTLDIFDDEDVPMTADDYDRW